MNGMGSSASGSVPEDRVALVTGASAGLGRAIAEELGRQGTSVAVASRSLMRVEEVAAGIRAQGGRAAAFQADMTKAEQIEALVAAAQKTWGSLHAVVFNSGGPRLGSFFELTEEDWKAGLDTTLMAFVRTVRATVPILARTAQKPAHLVAVVSSSVKEGVDNLVLSNTFRPAIAALIKSLARELGPRHVLVNAVAPGRISTERVREVDAMAAAKNGISLEEAQRQKIQEIPLGRYGEPQELARVAAFLLSPENTYVTGQTILVDGGMVRAM